MKFSRILPTLAVAGLLGVAAVAQAPKDIVDVAVENGKFTTLVKLVQHAGLVDTLKGKGPFTVFAPNDEAFAKLDRATVDALMNDKEALKRVLLFHVVPGEHPASKVVATRSLKTANELELAVRTYNERVTIAGSRVIATDVRASNGIIHVIDTVMIPPAAK